MSDARASVAANTTTTEGGSYTEKKIRLTVTRGQGVFASSKTNTIVFEGLRIQFQGLMAQGTEEGTGQMKSTTAVFGLPESDMNDLYFVGDPGELAAPFSSMLVEAGDDETGMMFVHHGQIINAAQDFNAQPDAAFVIDTQAGYDMQTTLIGPSSYDKGVPVSVVLKDMAKRAALNYVDQGIQDGPTTGVYEAHAARDQIAAICTHYNIGSQIEGGTLYVWDKKAGRSGEIPTISAQTGLMGYPVRRSNQVSFRCLFNPKVRYNGPVRLDSIITQVNGLWFPSMVQVTLQSQTPGGFWMMDVAAQRLLQPY